MKSFTCGDKVPASGIYRVSHSLPHIGEQREMYFEGSRFPVCDICAAGVYCRLESPCVPMAVAPMTGLAAAVC
jgi:hypothetical protein